LGIGEGIIMDKNEKTKWTMPEWMEVYRDDINNTGGNSIENLMNDETTKPFSNAIRYALIVCVESQVNLLITLHKTGKLKPLQTFDK
jgi:hypothetical protein